MLVDRVARLYAGAVSAVDHWVLAQLGQLHVRVCPRQILGARIGLHAGEVLGLPLPRSDKRLITIAEMDGCFVDGIGVTTGCRPGRRTLRIVDYGKVAATFLDTQTGQAVRIWPHPAARTAAFEYASPATDAWHAQFQGYQLMPSERLLRCSAVTLQPPIALHSDADAERVVCTSCGEDIIHQRQSVRDGAVICRACAGASYYIATPASTDWGMCKRKEPTDDG